MKFKDLREQKEPKLIQEGTWQIPKTMQELDKLAEMLKTPYPAKNRRKVLQFQKSIPMGDDHLYDVLDDVGMTDERRLQKWDEPVYINVLAGKALEEEGWIKGRVTNNDKSYTLTHHGFSDLAELDEMTSLPRKKGRLKPLRKLLKLERVKGGKLDPLSKMGKSKLTGQEIAKYYRDNPKAKQAARDKTVKKAIELALDLGGAQSYAIKQIEKLKRGLSKMPVVQQALRTANEEITLDEVSMQAKIRKAIDIASSMGGDMTGAVKRIEAIHKGLSKNKNVKKALQLANEEMTSTSSVAMPEIPLGRKHKVMKRKELEEGKKENKKAQIEKIKLMRKVKATTRGQKTALGDLLAMTSPKVLEGMFKQNPRGFMTMLQKMNPKRDKLTKADYIVDGQFVSDRGVLSKDQTKQLDKDLERLTGLNEETILYRVKDIQKPELDKFKSSARLMKLKMNVKQSPRGKETIIRLQGSKKQIRDFDAVARGKSSYGDPSLAMKEDFDLNEESATMKKVRQVIKKKGMMNIDGMKLDLTTASMIASVYDKVNPMNKKRMDSLKLPQLVNLTMKVAGKGKMKKEDAVERAKELADLKAKHKREIEQEKDEIAATKQTNESLWRNIHNKRKRGEKMRKPGEKGAPKPGDFERARGEAVSPAQQAAIAISKKERGEKPKNECADEKDFKPHKMYKGDKEVMANTYADHVKYDKMGYTHEKPKKEALDAKDKPFVKDLIKKLRGGSKTHAKQADDLEKAMNTESMSRAKRDAMRDMGTRKDRDDDGNPVATADDRKAADKNVVMQIRRVTDLSKPAQIELRNGKKVMLKPADAKMMMKKFDSIRKPQDRLKVQNAMNDKKMTVQGLKRLLGR